MRRVVIVQARIASTRLPGKVLMDLAGRPMLAQQLRRLRRCRRADEVVVAATVSPADDAIQALAESEGLRCHRGSSDDVLSRYVGAAREAAADIVVRVTSDCPLIDPGETDRVIAALEEGGASLDYASNVVRRTFPRGLDTEALTSEALARMDRLASSPAAREHVTLFLRNERPDLFRVRSVTDAQDNSDLRWTVDTAADLEMVRRLYAALDLGANPAPYAAVLAYVRKHPELAALNAGVPQKEA